MKKRDDAFAAIAVAVLLILTAWGNAIAMMIVSAAGLLVAALIYRKQLFKGAALVALVAFVVAAGIGLALSCGCFG